MPGLTLFDIKWKIWQPEGYNYIHTAGLLNGSRMVWADETQRPDHHAFRERMKRIRELRLRFKF